ncbi:MAG TPA: hypothetical protein VHT91_26465 [Kofleriaceae bacterium]|nr:hypothetical protein [Kofleriaceae bacterium]
MTSTAVVELDGAVEVDSIVDLDVDRRSRFLDQDPEIAGRSTYKVKEGVNGYVAVQVNVSGQRQGQGQRPLQRRSQRSIDIASATARTPGDLAHLVVRC